MDTCLDVFRFRRYSPTVLGSLRCILETRLQSRPRTVEEADASFREELLPKNICAAQAVKSDAACSYIKKKVNMLKKSPDINKVCHTRAGGYPSSLKNWIPVFTGMTANNVNAFLQQPVAGGGQSV
jgi:hypothetical protein